MTKYYVDVCIWRDLKDDRTDRFRPLGEWAFRFFALVRINKDLVLYSDIVITELLKEFEKKDIDELFAIVSDYDLLKKVELNQNKQRRQIS